MYRVSLTVISIENNPLVQRVSYYLVIITPSDLPFYLNLLPDYTVLEKQIVNCPIIYKGFKI